MKGPFVSMTTEPKYDSKYHKMGFSSKAMNDFAKA